MRDCTDITFIIDRSGSMEIIREDTIGGFNSFIEGQKILPGECVFSLYQFNTSFDWIYKTLPIKEVPAMTRETFVPRAGTALLDAIGKAITETGIRLKNIPEFQRPNKVMFIILTDGEENSSRVYNRGNIEGMIKTQRDSYNWQFIFLGANQDAIMTGQSLGILRGQTMNFAPTAIGTRSSYVSLNVVASKYRTAAEGVAVMGFADEDRAIQTAEGAVAPTAGIGKDKTVA